MPFRLRYMAHDLELPVGEFVVGRSTECQLSLDDPLVSRRHAVLRVRRDGVSVQDFGSRNGVLVNGVRISGERELVAGDKVGIGSQEMVLHAATEAHPMATSSGEEVYRRATQTLGAAYVVDLRSAVAELAAAGAIPGGAKTPAAGVPGPHGGSSGGPGGPVTGVLPDAATSSSSSGSGASGASGGGPGVKITAPRPTVPEAQVGEPHVPRAIPPSEASRSVQSFALLGGVADKALAMGKAEEAERILQALLNDVLGRARDGAPLDTSVTEHAAKYAARLAAATGKAAWVDYTFELYKRIRRVLPAAVIDELYTVVRKVKGLEPAGIRAYLDVLRESSTAFGPADRFLIQRIDGLERQIALK